MAGGHGIGRELGVRIGEDKQSGKRPTMKSVSNTITTVALIPSLTDVLVFPWNVASYALASSCCCYLFDGTNVIRPTPLEVQLLDELGQG